MDWLRAELHVHTVLSPCAAVEMIPPLIVSEALRRGIEIIAITDHNSSANVPAVIKAAQGSGLTVLPGMEVHTLEDVHVLTIFNDLEALQAWQKIVDQALPDVPNRADYFGEQYVVDENGEFLTCDERLLIQATSLSLEKVSSQASELGALVIPAHVDRKAYGLIGTLGFVPHDLEFPALELSRHIEISQALQSFPQIANYTLIQSGDVHFLDDFLGWNHFFIESPTISEIRLALQKAHGRDFSIKMGTGIIPKSS